MNYPEWQHLTRLVDEENPHCNLYQLDEDCFFYIEPAFYTQLMGMKDRHPDSFPLIIREIERIVKKHKKVIFTSNYEVPQTIKDGFIYREIEDVCDPLHIFVEDKSRGSDYGD